MSILVVDDQQLVVRVLKETLERSGFSSVQTTTDPSSAAALSDEYAVDLVILDIHMPGVDGFALLRALKRQCPDVPALVLTTDPSRETQARAFACGARDFISKAADDVEIFLRVVNLLELRRLQTQMAAQNRTLEDRVRERTEQLDLARLEVLDRLALAAEYRDDDTHEHAVRIGRTTGFIAAQLGLSDHATEDLRRAAQLHDIGKIAVPDAILLKRGRLERAEIEVMHAHTVVGARILSRSSSSLLALAAEIALTHHERWDGLGYPSGLRGAAIPRSGRIVAVADVFDALVHPRPYKAAWPLAEALAEISDQRGRHFDPEIVDAFMRLDHPGLVQLPPHPHAVQRPASAACGRFRSTPKAT